MFNIATHRFFSLFLEVVGMTEVGLIIIIICEGYEYYFTSNHLVCSKYLLNQNLLHRKVNCSSY